MAGANQERPTRHSVVGVNCVHHSSTPEGCRSGDHRIFQLYLPYSNCGCASQKYGRLFLYEVLRCVRVRFFGAESRTRPPILPKLRTPRVRAHFVSSTIRIAGGHHEENHFFTFCVCGLLANGLTRVGCAPAAEGITGGPIVETADRPSSVRCGNAAFHPSLPLQDNLAGYSESDSQ